MFQTATGLAETGDNEAASPHNAGTIFDVVRYSTHDGPGIRTTIFLKGCPLRCWWCHNPEGQSSAPQFVYRADRCLHCLSCVKACPNHAIEILDGNPSVLSDRCQLDGACVRVCQSGAREIAGTKTGVENVMDMIQKDVVFYDESGGGVTFSGGEPFAQGLFLQALLKQCREKRIHTAVETCGFVEPEMLLNSSRYVDLYLYDLKVMDETRHREFTGVSNKLILNNLKQLSGSHKRITVRFPLIPGVNDHEENVLQLGEYVSSLESIKEIHILPYHEFGVEKYNRLSLTPKMPDRKPPSTERVAEVAEWLQGYGLIVTVGG